LLVAKLATRFDDDRYYIPTGGSSAVGTLGFVEAGIELARQIEDGVLPTPEAVIVPTSSGGTLAGLRIGFDIADLDVRLAGVRVVEWYLANGVTISRLANKTTRLLDAPPGRRYSRHDIDLMTGYLGSGYAEPTEAGRRVQDIAAEYGLTLDPTYTAKTIAAIAGEFDDETVLYWHTLGENRPPMLSTREAIERLPDEYRKFLDSQP
jgi:D-cysteine desulfhydrase